MANKQSVTLQIYEVPEVNAYITSMGVGVYHTGVQVFNKEFAFGGHPHDFSGIYEIIPKNIKELNIHVFKFKESLLIGYTEYKLDQIRKIVKEMGSTDFKGIKYHLLHKNCNHFSNAFCKRICGKAIPEWVNRLVLISNMFPDIEEKIPKEYLTPIALKENVKQQIDKEKRHKKANNHRNKQQNESKKPSSPQLKNQNNDSEKSESAE